MLGGNLKMKKHVFYIEGADNVGKTTTINKFINNQECMSNIKGIYPAGEGAGYAGGIMTAALDGIKCAIKILERNDIN